MPFRHILMPTEPSAISEEVRVLETNGWRLVEIVGGLQMDVWVMERNRGEAITAGSIPYSPDPFSWPSGSTGEQP